MVLGSQPALIFFYMSGSGARAVMGCGSCQYVSSVLSGTENMFPDNQELILML